MKQVTSHRFVLSNRSLPSRERELKLLLNLWHFPELKKSLPSRERELKQLIMHRMTLKQHVAPFTGARVETNQLKLPRLFLCPSLPSRERELKLFFSIAQLLSFFESLPSRERELKLRYKVDFVSQCSVAPFTGARVETVAKSLNQPLSTSLPSRERELKRSVHTIIRELQRRSLHGSAS